MNPYTDYIFPPGYRAAKDGYYHVCTKAYINHPQINTIFLWFGDATQKLLELQTPNTKLILKTCYLKNRPLQPAVDYKDYMGDDLHLGASRQYSTNAHLVGIEKSQEDVRQVTISVEGKSQ